MRILLFHPSTNFYIKSPSVPLGALSIATFLKKNGHTVKICDRCIEKENINKTVEIFKPDIVGISIMSSIGIKDAKYISEKIKKLNIPVIWGGHYPTFIYEDALKSGLVDAVVLSEGEFTFIELINNLNKNTATDNLASIDGLAFLKNGEVVLTKPRKFADLAVFPAIDYSFVDIPKYFETFFECKNMLYLYGSKGCPFACTFCYNPYYNISKYRKRPVEQIFSEIDYLVENYGLDGIYFTDDVFCPQKDDLREFCLKMQEKNYKLVWGCQARIGQFDCKDFELMYASGCRWVFFGIETGSEEMQRKVGKNLDFSIMEDTFKVTREIGLTTISSLIVGFPEETEDQLRKTVNLAKKIDADLFPVNLYTPSIEQKLARELIAKGLYNPPKTLEGYAKLKPTSEYIQGITNIPKRELLVIRSYFHWVSFTRKDPNKSSKSFGFAKKAINDAFKNIIRFGIFNFIYTAYNSAKTLINVLWNVFAHPKIRKKYDLYINR